jgi:tetratricopeptide (TPR) repeat protein
LCVSNVFRKSACRRKYLPPVAPTTPSSTRWSRTPLTAPCCAAAGNSSTPASLPPSKAGSPEIVAAQPAQLARHCAEAGLIEPAVAYWLAAGRQAWARSAIAEAVALLRRGLALVPTLPDSDRRRERELDLLIAFGQALIANQGWGAPGLGEAYARARELATTLNRPRLLLIALQGEFQYHTSLADLNRAWQRAAELRGLGETTGDVPTRVLGNDSCAYACIYLGKLIAARAYADQALALYDPAHRVFYAELMPNDMLVQLLGHSQWLLACLGHIDEALSRRDRAVVEARRLAHPFTSAIAPAFVANFGVSGRRFRRKPAGGFG